MKKIIYLFAIAVLSLAACNKDKKQTESKEEHSKEMHMEADDHNSADHEHGNSSTAEKRSIEATTQKNAATSEIVDGYLQIKNALVADDKKGAAKGGKALLIAFDNFDMTKLTESQHKEYMDILENAQEHTEHIEKSAIDHQREHFEELSTDINDLITLVGTDKTLYRDFCPMANEGKGAIWLSEIKDIKNPFLGSKMSTCGKVKSQIN